MPLEVLTTPSFARAAKKLHAKDKKVVDQAIKSVADAPTLGEEKRRFVGRFRAQVQTQQQPRSFTGLCPEVGQAKAQGGGLARSGAHENFYAQLKR